MTTTIEQLTPEYDLYRTACDMAERMAPQARISETAALALAREITEVRCTASRVLVGTALYGMDTVLYGVIFQTNGVWYYRCGWLKSDGTLHLVDSAMDADLLRMRWAFTFFHRESLLIEVAI